MDVNGIGLRGIERVTGVHHTTVITWIKTVGETLPNAYDPDSIPQVGELDELETFVGSKKTRSGRGRRLTTFAKGSWGGSWATTVQKPSFVGDRGNLAVLFLGHGRLVSLLRLYSWWRPDCQQDIQDASGGGKYSVTPLSSAVAS